MDFFGFWSVSDRPPVKPDCFIVLSYCVLDDHTPAAPNIVILDLAIAWWKKFPESFLIMSTGDNQKLGKTNAAVMAQYARHSGVPKTRIIEEDRSVTTYENLINCRKIVTRKKFKHVTLVTYDLHTRRTLAVARRLGWNDVSWISIGGAGGPSYGIKTFQTYTRFNILIYELIAYVYNRLKGEL